MDDIAPLRQYGAPVTSPTDAYLFKPATRLAVGSPAQHHLLAEEAGAEA